MEQVDRHERYDARMLVSSLIALHTKTDARQQNG